MSENLFFDTSKLGYLGSNVIIGKTVRIRHPERVEIGDESIIDDFTYISTGLKMGKRCHIAAGVNISGGAGAVTMGDYVAIAAGSSVHAASSDLMFASLDYPSVPEELRFGGVVDDIHMEDFVAIGAHTVILPGVHLPEGFAAAAQTIVRKRSYDPWCLYGGAETEFICKRRHQTIDKLRSEGKL